ncbi:MAG: MFS transporter [Pseudomonadales bacterium]
MFYGWILLSTLSVIYFLSVGAIFYGFAAVIPQIIEDEGWSRVQVSAGFSILTAAAGLSGPLIALVIQRFGARMAIVVGSLFTIFGATLMYTGEGLSNFYLGLCFVGVGMGMQTVIPGTQLLTRWFQRYRALALGVFLSSAGLGALIAAPTFGFLSESYSNWRILMPVIAASALLSSILAGLIVRERPEVMGLMADGRPMRDATMAVAGTPHQTSSVWTVSIAIRTYAFWMVVLGASLAVAGSTIVNSQAILHMEELGLSRVLAASALGVAGLLGTLGRLISGVLGDRIEPRFLLAWGLALEAAGIAVLLLASHPVTAYIFASVFGLGFGLAVVATPALIANYFGSESYASLYAARGVLVTLMGAMAPIVAGFLYATTNGYSVTFLGFAILTGVAALLVRSAKPPVHSSVPVRP